jgi:hypothetical protein
MPNSRPKQTPHAGERPNPDIAGRQQSPEAAQAERQRLNEVLDLLPAGAALLSPDYHVPFANRVFEERFGKSNGQRCYEYLFNRTAPCENCETFNVLKTNAPHRWEWTGPDRRHYDLYAFPFADADGSPLIMEMGIDITERKRTDDALRFLVECGSAASGEDFFQALARYLGESLGMDFVCIDRLEEGSLNARTVAIYFDGKFEDNVSYALKDTPCGEVVGKTICCYPREVRHLFPKDAVLQEMVAESYVGVTLWGSQGQPIGLIAILGRQPLADSRLATSILQLVAVRAAAELERREAEAEVRRHAEELAAANEELTRFNEAMVGRELRMAELKQEVNALCAQAGQPPRYGSASDDAAPPTP